MSTQWKPSCKGGSARFSYSVVVAAASVFLTSSQCRLEEETITTLSARLPRYHEHRNIDQHPVRLPQHHRREGYGRMEWEGFDLHRRWLLRTMSKGLDTGRAAVRSRKSHAGRMLDLRHSLAGAIVHKTRLFDAEGVRQHLHRRWRASIPHWHHMRCTILG